MLKYELYWEHAKGGGVRLLRAYGITAEAELPEEIEGFPVTEIGDYCFAENGHLPEHFERTRVEETDLSREESDRDESAAGGSRPMETAASWQLHELSGRYIEKVILPDSVRKIGNLAFYNCTSLNQLEFGGSLTEIGSDAFMNCKKLHRMSVRCGSRERSGMRQILGQISSDMEVAFLGRQGIEAILLFPEYYESYDEIAPAHLFGRNIEGEGFRARQCFKDGIVDFAQYDTIFPKACAEESEKTLCRLALDRLRYPADLQEQAGHLYQEYIRAHAQTICTGAVGKRDMQPLAFLCRQGLIGREELQESIRLASEADWAEGAAYFLRLLEQYFPQKPAAGRYEFDDF